MIKVFLKCLIIETKESEAGDNRRCNLPFLLISAKYFAQIVEENSQSLSCIS